MERLDIVCVGSLKEKSMRDICAEYQKRLSRFCKLTITELGECRLPDSPSQAEIDRALDSEGEQMLKFITPNTFAVALCIEGKQLGSEAFSKKLEQGMALGGKTVMFIGSSHGLSNNVKAACNLKLSMSEMTFPHQLARCMLLEQIYRAYKIRYNESYHK